MSYHVVSFLDSPEKVGLAPSLSVIPLLGTLSQEEFVNNNHRSKNLEILICLISNPAG